MSTEAGAAVENPGWTGRHKVSAGLLLFFTAVAAYVPAMRNGFVWDDDIEVVNNDLLRTGRGLWQVWFHGAGADYLPVKTTVQWLAWHLWGTDPLGFHLLNLGLHALGAVLLWRWLARLRVPGPWLAGLLFAVHPVNVESVAWISELKNTLSLVFFLLSLTAYSDYEDRPSIFRYSRALGWFLMALLSKASVAPLPLVLLVSAYWRRGTVTWLDARRTLPFFLLAAMFGCLAILYQFQRALGPELLAVTSVGGPGSPLAAACLALGFYFFHAVIPVGLTVVYPKWSTGWPPFSQAVSFLVLAAILAWSWVRRRSWGRGPLCALGYFVAMLTPVMGFVKMAYFLHSPVADHFEYLAAIGVVALGAGAGACWAGRNARARPLLVVCAELAVGALFAGSWSHEADFRNEETLWQQTMARNPNAWAAYAGLGVASYDRGAYAQAATCLARACELEPENPLVRNDLGSALAALGRRDEAVVQYTKAMKLCENPVIRYNLVQTLLDLGRYDEALEQGRLAVRQYPKNASMHNLLAEACLKMARPGEAVSEARKALELDPSLSRARKTLAEGLKD